MGKFVKSWEVKALVKINGNGNPTIKLEDYKQGVAELKLHAKEQTVRVTVTPYDPIAEEEDSRSKAQNRYYHKLLDIICDHTGDTHLELHEKLKIELLGRPYVYKDKEVIVVPSTTELTTKTFGDYLERVFKFASEEFGLVLPSPKQY